MDDVQPSLYKSPKDINCKQRYHHIVCVLLVGRGRLAGRRWRSRDISLRNWMRVYLLVSFGLLTQQRRQRGFFQIGKKEKANLSVVGSMLGQKNQASVGRDSRTDNQIRAWLNEILCRWHSSGWLHEDRIGWSHVLEEAVVVVRWIPRLEMIVVLLG